MDMDGKIARIENAKNTKCERWAVVSTLESGKPIRVPILADRKLDENLFLNNETLSNHLTIRFNLDGSVNGKLITTLPKAEKTNPRRNVGIGLGHGLHVRPIRWPTVGHPNVRLAETA